MKKSPNREDLDPNIVFPDIARLGYEDAATLHECSRGKLYGLTKKNPKLFAHYKREMELAKKRVTAAPPSNIPLIASAVTSATVGNRGKSQVAPASVTAPSKPVKVGTSAPTPVSNPRAVIPIVNGRKKVKLARASVPPGSKVVASPAQIARVFGALAKLNPVDEDEPKSGQKAVICGWLLLQLKSVIVHKHWLKTLAESKSIDKRRAQRCMVLARRIVPKIDVSSNNVTVSLLGAVPEAVLGVIKEKVGNKSIYALYVEHRIIVPARYPSRNAVVKIFDTLKADLIAGRGSKAKINSSQLGSAIETVLSAFDGMASKRSPRKNDKRQ